MAHELIIFQKKKDSTHIESSHNHFKKMFHVDPIAVSICADGKIKVLTKTGENFKILR